jgi:hypothetical protein
MEVPKIQKLKFFRPMCRSSFAHSCTITYVVAPMSMPKITLSSHIQHITLKYYVWYTISKPPPCDSKNTTLNPQQIRIQAQKTQNKTGQKLRQRNLYNIKNYNDKTCVYSKISNHQKWFEIIQLGLYPINKNIPNLVHTWIASK